MWLSSLTQSPWEEKVSRDSAGSQALWSSSCQYLDVFSLCRLCVLYLYVIVSVRMCRPELGVRFLLQSLFISLSETGCLTAGGAHKCG